MVKSFNELTVGQYQEWYRIQKEIEDPLDREIALIALVTGMTVDEVENLPRLRLFDLADKLNSIDKTVTKKVKTLVLVNKRVYRAITRLSQLNELMSTNQFTAAQTWSKTEEDTIRNFHMLLPLFYTPYRIFGKPKLAENQQELAEEFKSALIGDVAGAVFFYSVVSEKLWTAYQPYSMEATKTITDLLHQIAQEKGSLPTTDGITQYPG
jgi:hypothetical protein